MRRGQRRLKSGRLKLPLRAALPAPRTRTAFLQPSRLGLRIGKALADDLRHGKVEAVEIGNVALLGFAIVESKHLLVKVTVKMEWLDRYVGSAQVALEQAPEILQAVSVNLSLDVPLCMVHNIVNVAPMQFVISHRFIGIDLSSVPHIAEDFVLQSFTFHIGHDLGANLALLAVKHPHDYSFPVVSTALLVTQTALFVHVDGLAAYPGLVNLYRATFGSANLENGAVLYGFADTVHHKPCASLSNANGSGQFIAANPVLAVCQHPSSNQPLVDADGGILPDGSDLDGELFARMLALALPHAASQDEAHVFASAGWTLDAVRPAQIDHVIKAVVGVSEVQDGLLQSLWRFHISTIAEIVY